MRPPYCTTAIQDEQMPGVETMDQPDMTAHPGNATLSAPGDRIGLSNEWHARPNISLAAPFRCTHIIELHGKRTAQDTHDELGACARFTPRAHPRQAAAITFSMLAPACSNGKITLKQPVIPSWFRETGNRLLASQLWISWNRRSAEPYSRICSWVCR